MLIELRLDAGLGSGVDAKRSVVGRGGYALGPERRVLQEDARAWVVLPVEWVVGVTLAGLFFHGNGFLHLIILMNAPHRAHL